MKIQNELPSRSAGRPIQAPTFERFPFRKPEDPTYRTEVPARGRGNPAYEACQGPRDPQEVYALIKASNPAALPADIQSKPAAIRREFASEVLQQMFPMKSQVTIEGVLNDAIRDSYVGRNPAEPGFMARLQDGANKIGATRSQSGAGPLGTSAVIGWPGLGKSETIKRLLQEAFPQVINHRSYNGVELGIQTLSWLYLSCPNKASVSGLIEWIAALLDHIFGTSVLKQVINANNDAARQRIIARELSLHITGILVIDEIQNIQLGPSDARQVFGTFLQELINTTRTRIVLVGTPEVYSVLDSEAMVRRMSGPTGEVILRPLELDGEYTKFIKHLCQWQVTKNSVRPTEELIATMHQLTGGNPGYSVNLWVKAQTILVGNSYLPDELITPDLLEYTMRQYFERILALVEHRKTIRSLSSIAPAPSTGCAPDQANANPLAIPQPRAPGLGAGEQPVGYNVQELLPIG